MIKILSKREYDSILEDNKQLEKEVRTKETIISRQAREIRQREEDYNGLNSLKQKEIKNLENELNNKEELNKSLLLSIEKLNVEINKLKKSNNNLKSAKGGLTCNNNKISKELKTIFAEKENLKEQLKIANSKLDIQAKKIREFASKQEHTIEEYKNDGLYKSLKNRKKNK